MARACGPGEVKLLQMEGQELLRWRWLTMAESTSELRAMFPCPRCGRTLVPAPMDASVIFHCKGGHELTLGEMLRAQSAVLKEGLERLLAEWGRQHQVLIETVEDARRNGYLDVAEIFNRHAKSLESRISKVRDACSSSDSSKRVNWADALGSV
jgi:hypothetical protein